MKISSQNWLYLLQKNKLIAVIRSQQKDLSLQMAKAVAEGGVNLIEITWNSDRASETISQLRDELPSCAIGTGTLLNLKQQKQLLFLEYSFYSASRASYFSHQKDETICVYSYSTEVGNILYQIKLCPFTSLKISIRNTVKPLTVKMLNQWISILKVVIISVK